MVSGRRWVAVGFVVCVVILETDAALKRIPMGFQGMRGKKSMEYQDDDAFIPEDELGAQDNYDRGLLPWYPKRAPMGFQGMRGKKAQLYDTTASFYPNFLENDYSEYSEMQNKRAPMGFQGMRGKKQSPLFSGYKRAPLGFHGMRGKKDLNDAIESAVRENKQNGMPEEATPLLGELPMLELGLSGHKERRSASYGFFGMRGKKMPSASSFFGMRGKKGPYNYPFRGQFIGVRGKKSFPSDGEFSSKENKGDVAEKDNNVADPPMQ